MRCRARGGLQAASGSGRGGGEARPSAARSRRAADQEGVGAHECLVGVSDVDGGGLGVGGLALGVGLGEHRGERGAQGAEGLIGGVRRAGLGGHGHVVHPGREAGGQATPVGRKRLAKAGEAQTAVPSGEASDVGPPALAHELGRGEGAPGGSTATTAAGEAAPGSEDSSPRSTIAPVDEGARAASMQLYSQVPRLSTSAELAPCAARRQNGAGAAIDSSPRRTLANIGPGPAPERWARAICPHGRWGAPPAAASAPSSCLRATPAQCTRSRGGWAGEKADSSSWPPRPARATFNLRCVAKAAVPPALAPPTGSDAIRGPRGA